MKKFVTYNQKDGIGKILVNRPERRNALSIEAQRQFKQAVAEAAVDTQLRVLLITGAGDQAFASGGDIKELAHHPEKEMAVQLKGIMSDALRQLKDLPFPVIGVINGDAYGGGAEILTACDLRLAAHDIQIGFVQVKVGLTTGWGGAGRLVQLLGQSRALELLMTGRLFSASEAKAIGFVHRIVARPDLDKAAYEWAEELIQLPEEALAATKALVMVASNGDEAKTDEKERELFTHLWPHPDHIEAMRAFLEKRPPQFGEHKKDV